MGVVAFDYGAWSVRYPALAAVTPQPLAQVFFNEAQLYCDNTASSLVTDSSVGGERSTLLNMLVAHIAIINDPQKAGLVGRVSSATEGSVTASMQFDAPPGTAQWYAQTQPGASYWTATAKYRTFRYAPGCPRVMDPWQRRFGA